ncbi:Probable oxidoreductase [Alloactinosynnema sp. L-07]|uniref:FAD-binding protein n=1 Tax=Alloactinosynnema sp. L-07 TaxID=1653480 RepID=UPI00065F04A5|nr:FAD-binding protein [Alloactinosynnema sp. L-07]CRK57653.1 Probable oxidoreductase [Alloactinosynnema sp. L-07]
MTARYEQVAGDPRLITSGPRFDACSDDFGHIVHHEPDAVVGAESVADVIDAVRYARAHNLEVVPRGAGHSTAGQAQSAGGVVIDMRGLDGVHTVEPGRAVVDGGTRWSTVTGAALERGQTPPVLTDYIELTVGGTLSVGGLSGTSHRYGAQTDNVDELDVVTSAGDLVTCSRTENRQLFDDVRAGRGRRGIITRATLTLIPAPVSVRVYHVYYHDLALFLREQLWLMTSGAADYIEGHARPNDQGSWWHRIEAAFNYTSTALPNDEIIKRLSSDEVEVEDIDYWSFVRRLADGETALRSTGHWLDPHPWTNCFIPESQAEQAIGEIMDTLSPDNMIDFETVLHYPVPRNAIATPRLSLPAAPNSYLFAVLRTASPGHTLSVPDMLASKKTIELIAQQHGGTAYLGSITQP